MNHWEEDLKRLRGWIVGVEGDLMELQLANNLFTEISPTTVADIEEIED